MSLVLKQTFLGPPVPSAARGFGVQIDVHKDGDTVAYGNSKFVITRSLTPGGPAKVYTEHQHKVKVARFNPSGYYVASADENGYVRVWSYTHAKNMIKKASKQLGTITDLCWDGEGKRIAVSGNGDKKGAAFSWDTGACIDKGTITGLPDNCPSVAMKPNRPFRMVIGSESGTFSFLKGPPYAMLKNGSIHKNVIQCIRYTKDGSKFATCSNDKKINVFDGKTAEPISTMKFGKKSRHNGFVYGLAFSADGTRIFTCSSDKTCKLWDVESRSLVGTFSSTGVSKPQVRHQQLGCVYSKHGPLSVSLSGDLTIYDVDKTDDPIKSVIVGHQAPLSALAYDIESDTLATGCRDGLICTWKDGIARRYSGDAVSADARIIHKAGVVGLCLTKDRLFSIGIDGMRNTVDVGAGRVASTEGIGSACTCLASARDKPGAFAYGNKSKQVAFVVGGKTAGSVDLPDIPTCLALSNDGTEIIASTADGGVHFISTSDLKIKKTINKERKVTAAAFSPDKSTYALATAGNYEIALFKSADHSALVESYWTHNANINALAFSPDGKYLVSGANDGNVTFWTPSDHSFKLVTFTHYQGVTALAFTKTGLATIGADNCLKTWELGAPEPAPAY